MVKYSEAGPSSAKVFPEQTITEQHLISQSELNDLVRYLDGMESFTD